MMISKDRFPQTTNKFCTFCNFDLHIIIYLTIIKYSTTKVGKLIHHSRSPPTDHAVAHHPQNFVHQVIVRPQLLATSTKD